MMVVPLNGALGRWLCKFVAILAIFLLFAWSLSQHQKSATELAVLEGQLQFAHQQLSSLHAQIDVITRHKEKIESLLGEERQRFERTKQEHFERISYLEAENAQCKKALAVKLNGTNLEKAAENVEKIDHKNHRSNAEGGEGENEEIGGQNEGNQQQKPIVEPEEEKAEEIEKKDEDPFEGQNAGNGGENAGNGGENAGIVGQIKPPNVFEGAVEKNEEEEKEKKQQTKKEPNGGEKLLGEDYIFRRPMPREDLVFHREAEGQLEGKGGAKKKNWMNGGELMRKLAEKKAKKEAEEMKAAAEMQQKDEDFRE